MSNTNLPTIPIHSNRSIFAYGVAAESLNQLKYRLPSMASNAMGTKLPEVISNTYYGVNNIYKGARGLAKELGQSALKGKISKQTVLWNTWTVGVGSLQLVRAVHCSPIGDAIEGPMLHATIGVVGLVGALIAAKGTIGDLTQAQQERVTSGRDWSRFGHGIIKIFATGESLKGNIKRLNNVTLDVGGQFIIPPEVESIPSDQSQSPASSDSLASSDSFSSNEICTVDEADSET